MSLAADTCPITIFGSETRRQPSVEAVGSPDGQTERAISRNDKNPTKAECEKSNEIRPYLTCFDKRINKGRIILLT